MGQKAGVKYADSVVRASTIDPKYRFFKFYPDGTVYQVQVVYRGKKTGLVYKAQEISTPVVD